ncbi:184_t:CDS:2 [Acaulospora morrowiae]|uniref:184_t:CDS:1 n=1 Tax=Acaulospora morrowiae TaxID=94023 RepID=A0A9N9DI55_9GLOM|nr:184_t:CDS:2 [Acaulospora morrowiae]
MSEVIDYRVSRIVVHCKDCGLDVGLYPARHKCGVVAADSLEPLPPVKNSSMQNNNIASNEGISGEGLWGKLRSVRNWKDINGDGTTTLSAAQPTQGYKLWDKLLSAAAAYKVVEGDSENESEKEDWEGETHISRILREYYMKKSGDIPNWLYDSKPSSSEKSTNVTSLRNISKRLIERNKNLSQTSNTGDILDSGFSKNGSSNRSEQIKVHVSPPSSPSPIPIINKGRENSGYDRSRNMNYTQGSQSSKNYDSDKYNLRINSNSLGSTRTFHAHTPSDDNGRMSQQRSRGTERQDNFRTGRSRELELITNTANNVNRARSVSPSPSTRVPPSGIYSRFRETNDIRGRNQDVRVPTGRNYGAF